MKKLITLIVAIISGITAISAHDRVTTDANALPAAAKTLINKYFKKTGINHIKVDEKVFRGNEYEVVLNNGTEIEFDSKGNLQEIDCGRSEVPAGLILKPIREYVNQNFKGRRIVSVDVNRNSYDIELNDGIDLKFDRSGKFIKIDD